MHISDNGNDYVWDINDNSYQGILFFQPYVTSLGVHYPSEAGEWGWCIKLCKQKNNKDYVQILIPFQGGANERAYILYRTIDGNQDPAYVRWIKISGVVL